MPQRPGVWYRYRYTWVTLALFVASLTGHWMFAWSAYVEEQRAHAQPVEVGDFVRQTARDTLENWQSEFLQLLWQVAGLALLLHVGSPQSREGDERLEAKIDRILSQVRPKDGEELIRELDRRYLRR